jgi:EpsD family peptidyl-prolyl cis-trans isomerase
MHDKARLILVAAVCLASGACRLDFWRGQPAPPTGQVVATVGDHEITTRDLQTELAGVSVAPTSQKAAQQAALQLIVRRAILADAARAQNVDKDPDFAVRNQRAEQLVLIERLEAKIAKSVPDPSRDEAEQFATDHPDVFDRRKVFTVEQIRFSRPSDPKFIEKIKPINTLDGVAALLTANNIGFLRGSGIIDAVGQDPRLIEVIAKLPPQEVFVFASGNDFVVNQILGTKIVPLKGEIAIKYALALIRRQRTQQAVARGINEILTKGAATVRFNKDYAPRKALASSSPTGK